MSLEKKHGAESWFSALKDDDDNVVSDLNGIMDAWVSFHPNLFCAESVDLEVQSEMLSFLSRSVPQSDVGKREGPFESVMLSQLYYMPLDRATIDLSWIIAHRALYTTERFFSSFGYAIFTVFLQQFYGINGAPVFFLLPSCQEWH